jgi:hypothetical protein
LTACLALAQACEMMDALKKNLRQEHVLIHDFLSTFYTQVSACMLSGRPHVLSAVLPLAAPSCSVISPIPCCQMLLTARKCTAVV